MSEITRFEGEYAFLSNFYHSPVTFSEIEFPTVEHAYQAAKTLNQKYRRNIAKLPSPSKAKQIGRVIPLREDWEEVKVGYMTALVTAKFETHDYLAVKLLETYPAELIEGNYWRDTFWGVCNGVGENMLGKILMQVRQEILDA